jgi:glycosyltransferase involved in cell wall biosynthesis
VSTETKRHCMVVHAYYPIGEPRVQREAEALIDNGYEVDVICLRQLGEPAHDVVYGVNVYRLPVRRHKNWGIVLQLLEYLAFFCLAFWRLTTLHFRRRYNSVQVHNPPDFLVFAALIPRLMGSKIILDLHDLTPEFYASRFNSSMNSGPVQIICLQECFACCFADHVITVTEPWRQTLIQRGLSPDKCSVVMNVADNKLFRRERIDVHPPQDSHFHLLYHGNIALQAVARLRHDLPDIYLTIHGRGAFLDNLRRLAQKLELGGHVRFSTEYIPIEELPALIASADLGLVPYRRDVFTDGILPTKLMEYAALGIPAVVARTSAISVYFDETMIEFFAAEDVEELARCIRTLYHNRSRLDELACNIQRFNQRYNWASQKIKYANLVKALAQKS